MLPITCLFFAFSYGLSTASAGTVKHGGNCSVSNQRLDSGTYQFYSECDAVTYCSPASICELKGCRKDVFPFGYASGSSLPPLCGSGRFCPDEGSMCLSVAPVGSPCQFNRDDQCEGPPNHKELADHTGFGLNVNGSVCLNNSCMWANASLGDTCVVQNTAFAAFGHNGKEFADIVSRDNCQVGLYCDSQKLHCLQTKVIGVTCNADKECSTYNCLASGMCGPRTDTPTHVATWVYALVGAGSCGGILATLIALFLFHKKEREAERERRMLYWQEQHALRQNFIDMQKTAQDSLPSFAIGSSRSQPGQSPFRYSSYADSQTSMLGGGMTRSSALRFNAIDSEDVSGGSSDIPVMQRGGKRYSG
ncbi:hypothetical protein POSPLADRAFT_1177763 [Postia placenta MAD-698-R-SB12]|uniref:Uncharacterized protein n=1 Tax=Postia placenta MAD-698-R-SB12 TaxID=670580 RepID=A0A1X6NCF6_9APHY|nr:hypothetical protein POSPLADRAFT_1177763 [Postia placenta MAD-698-R-SB12]OSX66318.1 hypothetical protein POSPLADRAFT_1177763 [Postia placenta MAD-698-R-SB12]